MEELQEVQLPTNICRTKVIFTGNIKSLTELVNNYNGEINMFTYIIKLFNNEKIKSTKSFMDDMLTLTKDTEIEYVEFTVGDKEVEMSLLDSGYCNANIITLIAKYFKLKFVILSYNQDTDFFINTDKGFKHYKHKLALLNFNKEVVAFGSSLKEAFDTIGITISDKMLMLELLELLSSYNLIISEFQDNFPPSILNENNELFTKYMRLFK